MKSVDILIVIFVFGLGVSFVTARGIWEARLCRLSQLKGARAKRQESKKTAN